jgi:hypothetical protein
LSTNATHQRHALLTRAPPSWRGGQCPCSCCQLRGKTGERWNNATPSRTRATELGATASTLPCQDGCEQATKLGAVRVKRSTELGAVRVETLQLTPAATINFALSGRVNVEYQRHALLTRAPPSWRGGQCPCSCCQLRGKTGERWNNATPSRTRTHTPALARWIMPLQLTPAATSAPPRPRGGLCPWAGHVCV